MTRLFRILLQVAFYAAFAAFVGHFSQLPRYEYAPQDKATIKLSLSHATERVVPCIQLAPTEIAALPPNERHPGKCERERLAMTIELEIDGTVVINIEAPPSGLWKDGPASVYERFDIDPGVHRITARLRDTGRSDGWDYMHTEEVELEAGHYFVVTFRAGTGGFNFR